MHLVWGSRVWGSIGDKHLPQMIIVTLMQTLSYGHPLSRATDFGSGSVLPLHSGEPEADGTGDPKRFRCPIMGSCIILLQTLSFGDPLSWATDFGSGSVDLSNLDLWIKQT